MENRKLSIALSIVLSIQLTACGQGESTENLIENAKVSISEKSTNEAIVYLKKAISGDKLNGEARFLLGTVYLKKGQWVEAQKELEQSAKLGFEHAKLSEYLAKVYFYIGDTIGLEELQTNSKGFNAAVSFFIGADLLNNQRFEQGISALNEIVSKRDDSKYSKLSSILIDIEKNQVPEASMAFEELLVEYPNFAAALLHKAKLHLALNEKEKSSEALLKFINVHPNAHEQRLFYASVLAQTGKLDVADKQADALLKLFPYNPLLNEIKAQKAFSDKQFREAKKFADTALNSNSQLNLARIISGVSSYELNEIEMAYSILVPLEGKIPTRHPAITLLNSMRFKLGYVDEAVDSLSELPSDDLGGQILSASAKELLLLGRKKEAVALVDKALEKEPENNSYKFQKGVLTIENDRVGGRKLLIDAIEKDANNITAVNILVNDYIDTKEYERAINIAQLVKDANPSFASFIKAVVYKKQGNSEASLEAFTQVVELDPNNAGAYIALGDHFISESKTKAFSYYAEAYKLKASKVVPKILSMSKDDSVGIKKLFEDLLSLKAEELFFHVGMAQYYFANGEIGKSYKVINDALEVFEDNTYLLLQKATLLGDSGYEKDALELVDYILTKEPDNLYAIKKRIEFLVKLKEFSLAEKEQKNLLNETPNSFEYIVNLINIYIDSGKLSEAEVLLDSGKFNNQTQLIHNRLLGKILFMKKDYKAVLDLLSPVYEFRKSQDVLIELVQSLQNLDKNEKALDFVNAYLNEHKDMSTILWLKLAQIYQNIDKSDNALETYRKLLSKEPENAVILNNYAWLQYQLGMHEKAESNTRKALNLEPDNPYINNTFGTVLVAQNKLEDGVKFLKKAIEMNDNLSWKLSLLKILVDNGRVNEANNLRQNIPKEDIPEALRN